MYLVYSRHFFLLMEKFRSHQVVLQNTTHLGTANYDVNRLAQRKVRMV